MMTTIVGRLSQAFLLLLVMSVIGFAGIHSVGNPVFNIVNIETATAEDIRNATIALGLDQPLWWQYFLFMGNVVTGNFGTSYIYHLPAFSLVMSKLPATFELASTAMLIAAPCGTLLGLLAGRRQGGLLDRIVLNASVFALSIPSFWLSMMLILLGALAMGWFPSSGRGETVSLLGREWSFSPSTVSAIWRCLPSPLPFRRSRLSRDWRGRALLRWKARISSGFAGQRACQRGGSCSGIPCRTSAFPS